MRFLSVIFVFSSFLLGILLFQVKYQVVSLESRLQTVEKKIAECNEAIKVSHAEWSFLTQPERIQKLSGRFLSLKPLLHSQVVSLEEVSSAVEEENLVHAVLQGAVSSGRGL